MRAAAFIVAQIAYAALLATSAGAQGPGAIASSRVTVVVPERRPARNASASVADASVRPREAHLGDEVPGRSDTPLCAATLDLGAVGRASVSCLETADPGRLSPGVAIELETPAASETGDSPLMVELILDDGAVLRLPARPWRRGGRDIQRVTTPAAALRRVAASRQVTLRMRGGSHVLSADAMDALRALALRLER